MNPEIDHLTAREAILLSQVSLYRRRSWKAATRSLRWLTGLFFFTMTWTFDSGVVHVVCYVAWLVLLGWIIARVLVPWIAEHRNWGQAIRDLNENTDRLHAALRRFQ